MTDRRVVARQYKPRVVYKTEADLTPGANSGAGDSRARPGGRPSGAVVTVLEFLAQAVLRATSRFLSPPQMWPARMAGRTTPRLQVVCSVRVGTAVG